MESHSSFFFPDNQVTARLARELDWKNHPMGEPSQWPISLKLTLNTIFNTKHAISLFWGEENYFFYNDAYIPMLGSKKHPQAMGKKGKEVWPEVWGMLEAEIHTIMTKGTSSWFEDQYVPIERPDQSSEAYFTYSYSPVIDEEGVIRGTLIISIENTQRMIAEKKVRETQKDLVEALERFKLMSEALPQLVWTCLPTGACNYLSKQWVDYTGIPEENQLGLAWIQMVIHPEDVKRTQEHWLGAVQGLHPYDIEYRIRKYDGSYRWFKVRGTPFKNAEGKTLMWFGTCTDIEEAKKKQIEFERMVDLSPAMLWITESDGYCSYLSHQWYEMTGQTVEEGIGHGWLDITHPDDKKRASEAFMKANFEHAQFKIEYRLKMKDGQYRWCIDAGNPRFDAHGKYLGMAGTVLDIHDKKMAEEAMLESRGDLYRILMQAPSGVAFLKGPELVYTIVNEKYLQVIGKGESIVNLPIRKALPEIGEEAHKIFENVYDTGETFITQDYKATIIRNNIPTEVYFSFAVQRINNSHGQAEGIIIIGEDVTENVRVKIAKEQITKHLQAIVHNMGEGLILTDATGKMIFWNPAACVLHDFSDADEAIRMIEENPGLFKSYSLQGQELYEWPLASILRGQSFIGREVVLERTDTGRKWIASYNGSPIFDENDKLVFAVLTIRDVTERIDTEHELIKAVNSRDDFLSIISHELKTPLTSLKLQNQSNQRKIAKGHFEKMNAESLSDLFSRNDGQINKLIRLVDDMLDITRIQSGKLSYNFEHNDLCAIVREAYERHSEQYENANVTLTLHNCENIMGYFDKERIEQVLTNLLTNALKYGKGKEVTIEVKNIGDLAHIEVCDKGLGIAPENFEIIFKKFERVISADEVSGLGIGLFISKQIIEAHGGRIWVDSKLGMGSKFIAELPLD